MVALEAAIVLSLAMSVSLGTIPLGLMSWTKAGLQATAAITARCMGIGATACTGIGGQAYAVAQSRRFLTSTACEADDLKPPPITVERAEPPSSFTMSISLRVHGSVAP